MRVVVFVNDAGASNIQRLERLCREILGPSDFELRILKDLENPWMLTWAHKPLIFEEFCNSDAFTHFIYTEDDIILHESNFSYWLSARELLNEQGLLPSFIRLEYHGEMAALTASDSFWPIFVPCQSYAYLDGMAWVAMPNPYNPFFILDQALAAEYVGTASFQMAKSSQVVRWGLAERAAMGLCNENFPEGFPHRYVVPVDASSRPLNPCLVFHAPSNYANSPSVLGKLRLDQLFVGADALMPASTVAAEPVNPRWTNVAEAPVSDLGEAYFLITYHDTVLYYDFDNGVVRHGPFGVVPLNFAVSLMETSGQFFALDNERIFRPIGWRGTFVDCAEFGLEVEAHEDGAHSLSRRGRFLSALMEGDARWEAEHCLQWERHRLVRADTLAGLAWLRRKRWKAENGDIVSWRDQPLDFGGKEVSEASALAATISEATRAARGSFSFGGARVFFALSHQRSFILNWSEDKIAPSSLRIMEPGGRYRDFVRC